MLLALRQSFSLHSAGRVVHVAVFLLFIPCCSGFLLYPTNMFQSSSSVSRSSRTWSITSMVVMGFSLFFWNAIFWGERSGMLGRSIDWWIILEDEVKRWRVCSRPTSWESSSWSHDWFDGCMLVAMAMVKQRVWKNLSLFLKEVRIFADASCEKICSSRIYESSKRQILEYYSATWSTSVDKES